MKISTFLILIGVGVVLLVVGVVFVVPWVGKMSNEMKYTIVRHGTIIAQHDQHIRVLEASAREPLTAEQEKLLAQLLEIAKRTDMSKNPNDLEQVLSSELYLTYLKMLEDEDYEDFSAYVAAMPTARMKTIARTRVRASLGEYVAGEELKIWTNYYFKVRAWGITVEAPQDNMKELNKFHQEFLIGPLMESDPDIPGLHTRAVHPEISYPKISSIFMTEHNTVFKEVWREHLEADSEKTGLLRCAIAAPGEFALMHSFFADTTAFQKWILKRPEPELDSSPRFQ